MIKHTFFLLLFLINNVYSQDVKVNSYKKVTYDTTDTLKFSLKNISSKVIKINFSIDLYYQGEWREIDNDIFEKKPKVYHYFFISKNCRKKFDFPVSLIDSIYLKEIKSPKFRIVLNVYRLHPFKLTKYFLDEFIIKN